MGGVRIYSATSEQQTQIITSWQMSLVKGLSLVQRMYTIVSPIRIRMYTIMSLVRMYTIVSPIRI